MVLTFLRCPCVWLLNHSLIFLLISNLINKLRLHQFLGTKIIETNKLLKTDANLMIQKDWEYTLLQKECHFILPCEQGADGLTRVHWGVVFFRGNVYQASSFALKASFDFCRSFSHIVHILSINALWIKKIISFYQQNQIFWHNSNPRICEVHVTRCRISQGLTSFYVS